ncbi:MAG: type II toxin-antitoxin system HicA family toxin [Chthoniobacterales bacterium]
MRIPRDISGIQLVKKLRYFGYSLVRQEGSHLRLTTNQNGQHHITVPNHSPMRLGTLQNLLKAVAIHHDISLEEVLQKIK